MIETLEQLTFLGEINEALEELPQGLEHLYLRTFKSIQRQSRQRQRLAVVVAQWLVCAVRPLTTPELAHALARRLEQRHLY